MSTLVRHAMTEAPKTLSQSMTADDAAGIMADLDVGAVPVAQDGELLGLVTDRDLVGTRARRTVTLASKRSVGEALESERPWRRCRNHQAPRG
jgi:CBS domain-containing protein